MTEAKIIQAPQISVAALKAIAEGHDGPLTINIHVGGMNASINGEASKKEIEVLPRTLPTDDEALLAYIETLPEPRLRNFIDHIYQIAVQKFQSKTKVAEWLGVSYRTAFNRLPMNHPMENQEKEMLIEALKQSGGNVRRASVMLDIPYSTAIQRVRRWNLRTLGGKQGSL